MVEEKPKNLKTKMFITGLLVVMNLFVAIKLVDFKPNLLRKKIELIASRRDLSLLDKLASDYEREENKLGSVLSSLPKTYFDIGVLAYKIEKIADLTGLSAKVSFEKDTRFDDETTSVGVQIITTGNYISYKNFLNSLANLPYNTAIESTTFENKEGALTQTTMLIIYMRND